MADLRVDIKSLLLESPLIAAAGTCGYVNEISAALDSAYLGALTTKSITRHPRIGNDPWRMIDLPVGMLNAIGLANVGLDRFIAEKLPDAADLACPVIASIAGDSVEDYVAVAAAFDAQPHLPAVELNVSCPNTADGLTFGEHPRALSDLLMEVRPALRNSVLIVKLSPNVGDIVAMAEAAIQSGADALTLINTVTGMAIDVESGTYRLSNMTGGLSGPAIHPIAVRMVNQVYHAVARDAGVPIIGLGGVMRWQDAAELILAGATAVGMGTALFVDPGLVIKVGRGLDRWIDRMGCQSVRELTGAAK